MVGKILANNGLGSLPGGVAVGTVLLIIIIHKLHCHIVGGEWSERRNKKKLKAKTETIFIFISLVS